MFDITKINKMDAEARGHVTIDYTDPVTGKVKERIESDNHCYIDSIMTGDNGNWRAAITDAYLVLTDDQTRVDPDFPYIIGTMRGYGRPAVAGSGNYLGTYIAAESYRNVQSSSGVSWKFKYEWLASQALGSVYSIGLTNQYQGLGKQHYSRINLEQISGATSALSDGRYYYTYSGKIITKRDFLSDYSKTIDLTSKVTGITALGMDGITGKTYVYYYSSTAEKRRMYEFDADFIGTPTEYVTSNITLNGYYTFFVYNEVAYTYYNSSFCKVPFVQNEAYTTIAMPSSAEFPRINSMTVTSQGRQYGKYIIMPYAATSTSGVILDRAQEKIVGEIRQHEYNAVWHPFTVNKLLFGTSDASSTTLYNSAALAQYKLPPDAPQRPDGFGMAVTYELVVNW